jgi:hypothetical protein
MRHRTKIPHVQIRVLASVGIAKPIVPDGGCQCIRVKFICVAMRFEVIVTTFASKVSNVLRHVRLSLCSNDAVERCYPIVMYRSYHRPTILDVRTTCEDISQGLFLT